MPRRQSPRRKRSRRSKTQRRSPKRSLRRRRYRGRDAESASPRRSSPHQLLQGAFQRKSEQASEQCRKNTMMEGKMSLPLPPPVSYDVAAMVVWTEIQKLGPPLMRDVQNFWYILPYTFNGGLIAYRLPDELSSDVPAFVRMFTATIVPEGGNAQPFHMTPLQRYEPAQYQSLNMSGVNATSLTKNDTRNVNMFALEKLQPNWGTVSEFVDVVSSHTSPFTCNIFEETYKLSKFVSIQSNDREGMGQFPIVYLYRDVSSTTIKVVQFAPSQTPCFGEFIPLVLPSSRVSPTPQSPPPSTFTPTTPTTDETSSRVKQVV